MKEIRDTKLVKTAITKITYQSDDGKREREKQSIRQLKYLDPIYIYDDNDNKKLLCFRDQIILRDNFICKKCKNEYDDIILEIHHLDSVNNNPV